MTSDTRSNALDGLRGVAALAVVFYHGILHMDATLMERVLYRPLHAMPSVRDGLTKIALLIFNGHTAVYIFFVLSGCVLTLSLNRKLAEPAAVVSASFLLSRAARLYPPVIACMLLMLLLKYLPITGYPPFSFQQFLENASLTTISMHGPSSTVQAELLAAPLVLAVWLLRRKFGPIALVFSLAYGMIALDSAPMVGWMPNMHAYLIAFVCGMAVAEPAVRGLVATIRPAAWWATLAALILSRAFHPGSLPSLLAMTGLSAVLVAGLLYGQKGSLARLLETAPVQTLGRISFSFYLLNVPMLYLIWAFTDRWAWTKDYALETGLVVGAISVAMTWPLALLSEKWIERPAIKAGRIMSSWVARFAPAPAPISQMPSTPTQV
jgi:peptidoglycan/LPS O-acetylase OafA/YrhL